MIDEKPLARLSFGGRHCTIRKQRCEDGSTLYSFVDDSGDSQMKVYSLLPGINLTHHSVHIDRSYLGAAKKGNVIEIHHCLEGRIECSYENGHLYLTPGDLAVEIVERDTQEFEFPLRHYHGITISINTDIAPKCFSCLLKDVDVQPLLIARRLCRDRRCFVIRSKEYIEHLFSEMYTVPCENVMAYYKIKLLELLLILSGIDPNENKISSCTVSEVQAKLAKEAAAYITENADQQITVASLAERFHVSATHLQNIFKAVFGVTVFSYVRIHKINAAALQLVKTDKTVMEIAGDIGYDNASKFASAFREIMNETPLEYRKSHRIINIKSRNASK